MNLLIKSQPANAKDTGKTAGSGESAAPGAALDSDLDLLEVIRAWPNLPLAIRDGIIAMVKATESLE